MNKTMWCVHTQQLLLLVEGERESDYDSLLKFLMVNLQVFNKAFMQLIIVVGDDDGCLLLTLLFTSKVGTGGRVVE